MTQNPQTEKNTEKASKNKTELDLYLIDQELLGSIIAIIAYIILIVSSQQSRKVLLQGQMKTSNSDSNNDTNLNPTELALISSWLSLLSIIILAQVAFRRLSELQAQVESGSSHIPLTPNIYITTGFIFSIVANIIKVIGAQQRYALQRPVTIL